MRALVTGGAGFIGSNLVKRLVEDDDDVLVVDNMEGDWENFGAKHWKHFGRLGLDVNELESKHIQHNHDVFFHCAANASIPYSLDHPREAEANNVGATINLLELAREYRTPVIYSSSSSIYGDVQTPYSLQKSIGEQYLKLYWELYKVPSVSLRYFNVYGEGQPDKGAYKLALGIFLKQYKQGKPFTIVGTGKQRRDFVHVDDVVRANLEAYENVSGYRVYDVGYGNNWSINEVVNIIDSNHPRVKLSPRIEPFENLAKLTDFEPRIDLKTWIHQQLA